MIQIKQWQYTPSSSQCNKKKSKVHRSELIIGTVNNKMKGKCDMGF
jgi:hypothetical protein